MTFTTLLPLISAFVTAILGFFVFWRNMKNKVNITFFAITVCIVGWLVCTFMMFLSKDNINAIIFWDRLVYSFVVFVPVFTYQLYFALAGKKFDKLVYLFYVLSFLFLLLTPTKYFVDDVYQYSWGVHTKAQLFHHIFLGFFVICILLWLYRTFKFYKSLSPSALKTQTKYIFLAFAVFYTIAPLGFLSAYGVGMYPVTYFSGLIFTVIMAYSINKYGVLDITTKMVAENIIATMNDYVVAVDKNMKVALANNAVLKGLNYDKAQLKSKPIKDIFLSDVSNLSYEELKKMAPLFNYKIDMLVGGGQRIPVSANVSVLQEKSGSDFGIVFVMRDMREIEQMVEGLKKGREDLEAAKRELEKKEKEIKKSEEKSEQINKIILDRELQMIELKKEVEELRKKQS